MSYALLQRFSSRWMPRQSLRNRRSPQVKERASGALALAAGSAGRLGFSEGRTERRHSVVAARVDGGDGAPHGQNQWRKQDLVEDHGRDEPVVHEGERALGDGI